MDVCMVGTGEYTTGWVHQSQTTSDKKKGVVALVLMDLRRRGLVKNLKLVGVQGTKMSAIRQHLKQSIKEYKGLSADVHTFPGDDECDDLAYIKAFDTMKKGDAVTIFTPDHSHYDIAMAAVQRGLHVLLTKPPVTTVKEHKELMRAADAHGVVVDVDFHKRLDPIYADACRRVKQLGDFSYFYSFMSQPHTQLKTFKKWAHSTDISYYLNSHHIDIHCQMMKDIAKPVSVKAVASSGLVSELYGVEVADCITLLTTWKNLRSNNMGMAVYVASWAAPPKGEVHSQQKFECHMHKGCVNVDQAHRGYSMTSDEGYQSLNPLYMAYTAEDGKFVYNKGTGIK